MTEAKILSSIQDIANYLKNLEISFDLNFKAKEISPSKFSEKYYYQSINSSCYQDIYTVALENNDYDILITDDQSFFQFSAEKEKNIIHKIRYAFFPSYKLNFDYNSFSKMFNQDQPVEELYNHFLSLSNNNQYVCPIRYDYSIPEYKEYVHPVSHLHIGFNTNIRIPISKILKPCQFVDFIIRYFYSDVWNKHFLNDKKSQNHILSLKNQSEIIEENYFSKGERNLLFLD